ncbi:hypothetical protein QCA50_002532 [Cerrena zonata]|uniref:RRM Nup35-type domain-containing protein n=1 Tax=Cerrena zonata TaxID=2478898 RepID=A0AAW0GZB1_9APHY
MLPTTTPSNIMIPPTNPIEGSRGKERGPSILINGSKSLHTSPSNETVSGMKRVSLRRSSSRIERWIQHQQVLYSATDSLPDTPVSTDPPSDTSNCHPYLAYPQLNHPSLSRQHKKSSTDTAVLITEHDGDNERVIEVQSSVVENAPSTPRKSRSRNNNTASENALHTPPSRRKFDFTLTQHGRKPSGADSVSSSTFTSIFQHRAGSGVDARTLTPTKRPTYLSPSSIYSSPSSRVTTPELATPDTPSTGWRNGKSRIRPTVLGHFTRTLFEGQTTADDFSSSSSPSPPRPSTSSTFTRSTASVSTAATSYGQSSAEAYGSPSSPSKFPGLGTLNSQSPTSLFRSSPSLWSLPTDASHLDDPPYSTKVVARDLSDGRVSTRISQQFQRGHSGNGLSLGSVSQILASPRRKKKRKLVITGVPVGDKRRTDALLKWCQTFGEVSQITRAQNGDLYIDFKSSEVADTVCRLNARVYIAGVGSVGLSWFTGKRP